MNYREGHDQFLMEYETACRERGVTPRKLNQKEVLIYLSKTQKYLANEYDLIPSVYELNLTSGKYEYTEGIGADDIPADIKRIDFIQLNNSLNTKLGKKNKEELITPAGRGAGLPTAWTLHSVNANRTLEINSIPDKSYADDSSYRLIINYIKKLYTYTGKSIDTFADLDFTEEEDWGGSFALPAGEWEELMLMGAAATAIGPKAKDLKAEYYELAEKKGKKKPRYTTNKLKYSFGIP